MDDIRKLVAITEGCRPDMHEPDEQDLKCWVVGDHLDNAFGNSIRPSAIVQGHQEYVVCLERFTGNEFLTEQFNLATLIAWARNSAK